MVLGLGGRVVIYDTCLEYVKRHLFLLLSRDQQAPYLNKLNFVYGGIDFSVRDIYLDFSSDVIDVNLSFNDTKTWSLLFGRYMNKLNRLCQLIWVNEEVSWTRWSCWHHSYSTLIAKMSCCIC